jgi:hypothetical protein
MELVILLGCQIDAEEMGGAYGTHGKGEKLMHNFRGNSEGKGILGISRRRWENNIKLYLKRNKV